MIYLILIIIALIVVIAIMYKYNSGSNQEQALKVDKKILEGKLKNLELEKGLLIKHAADALKDTITSKQQLAEVKSEIIKKYDSNDIDSVIAYINGGEQR